jgi:hypothetical protein
MVKYILQLYKNDGQRLVTRPTAGKSTLYIKQKFVFNIQDCVCLAFIKANFFGNIFHLHFD